MNKALPVTLLGAMLLCSVASAQFYPYPPRAATAGESYARGFADVVRSAGEANLMNSEAAKNYEAARSMYFDNRMKWTNTYFEMRQANKRYRDYERGPSVTQEMAVRMAQDAAPRRLNSLMLDPVTGRINWPLPLQDPQYNQSLRRLEELFAQRAERGGALDLKTYQEIQTVCESLLAQLQKNIGEYKPDDYLAARRFIESLAYEVRFPIS